jgi:predicted metalloprotease
MRTRALTFAALAVAMLGVPACSSTVAGTAVSDGTTSAPVTSAATPAPVVTASPAPAPFHPQTVNEVVNDIVRFWREDHNVRLLIHPQAASTPLVCTDGTQFPTSPAAYCDEGNILLYDAAWVTRVLKHGDIGSTALQEAFAHEVGHAIHDYMGSKSDRLFAAPPIDGIAADELSADCFSGMYMASTGESRENMITMFREIPSVTAVRVAAFETGLATVRPRECLTNYGG